MESQRGWVVGKSSAVICQSWRDPQVPCLLSKIVTAVFAMLSGERVRGDDENMGFLVLAVPLISKWFEIREFWFFELQFLHL